MSTSELTRLYSLEITEFLELNLPIIVSSANITDIRAVILATGPLSKLTFCFMNSMSCKENRRHCITMCILVPLSIKQIIYIYR